jgi:hypothetical protein
MSLRGRRRRDPPPMGRPPAGGASRPRRGRADRARGPGAGRQARRPVEDSEPRRARSCATRASHACSRPRSTPASSPGF